MDLCAGPVFSPDFRRTAGNQVLYGPLRADACAGYVRPLKFFWWSVFGSNRSCWTAAAFCADDCRYHAARSMWPSEFTGRDNAFPLCLAEAQATSSFYLSHLHGSLPLRYFLSQRKPSRVTSFLSGKLLQGGAARDYRRRANAQRPPLTRRRLGLEDSPPVTISEVSRKLHGGWSPPFHTSRRSHSSPQVVGVAGGWRLPAPGVLRCPG